MAAGIFNRVRFQPWGESHSEIFDADNTSSDSSFMGSQSQISGNELLLRKIERLLCVVRCHEHWGRGGL